MIKLHQQLTLAIHTQFTFLYQLILLPLIFLLAANAYADQLILLGAGATFPYPIYAKWAQAYQNKTGIKVNYQSIGSGGGIKQIQVKTVDFGATDQPLTATQLQKSSLIQFPTVIGGIVPVVNLANISSGQLKLTGSVLADIYLGKIKKWNDAAIKNLNPTITLPDQDITVVHRSDGSGTTFLFSHYLSSINPTWESQVGINTSVDWPVGIGGKGNEGVAAYVQNIKGAIGYLEYAYAKQNKISYVQLQNKAGQFVNPSIESFKAAADNANWQAANFAVILTNEPGNTSWPITGATFVLMQQQQTQALRGKEVLNFFNWAYINGSDMALQLDYVPLPQPVIKMIENVWKQSIKNTSGQAIWP